MKIIKAVYNFLVGDMIILIGTGLALLLLIPLQSVSVLHPYAGAILVIITLVILGTTLARELLSKK